MQDKKEQAKRAIHKSIRALPARIEHAYTLSKNIKVEGTYTQVAIVGMGGSSIAGQLFSDYLEKKESKVPVLIIQDYHLSKKITVDTLVVISSYSGNTEEAISTYKECIKKKQPTIILTSGGRLKTHCDEDRSNCFLLPRGLLPRQALPYLFFPLIKIAEQLRWLPSQAKEVTAAINAVSNKVLEEKGKNLSAHLHGKIPLIYSSASWKSVVYRWKTQINEMANTAAFSNVFPELTHNEINGFEKGSPFYVLMLKQQENHTRIKKRMDAVKKILGKNNIGVSEIAFPNNLQLASMYTAIQLGDFISFYLAERYDIDPQDIQTIEELKKTIGKW